MGCAQMRHPVGDNSSHQFYLADSLRFFLFHDLLATWFVRIALAHHVLDFPCTYYFCSHFCPLRICKRSLEALHFVV